MKPAPTFIDPEAIRAKMLAWNMQQDAKGSKIVRAICNGLGSQSMDMLLLARDKKIEADVAITSDTGWEEDCVWNTGERTSAREYFDRVVVPLASEAGMPAKFVRAENADGTQMPSIVEYVRWCASIGRKPTIPMFGSDGGRLRQSCTDRWKIGAMRQEARRMDARRFIGYQGIHAGEAWRRTRGIWLEQIGGGLNLYQTTNKKNKMEVPVKWCRHIYPLVDLKKRREDCQKDLDRQGIPYLISSQCNGCPHMDLPRYERLSPESLDDLVQLEKMFNGELFFTNLRIPLLDALEEMKRKRQNEPISFMQEIEFGCDNNICGI